MTPTRDTRVSPRTAVPRRGLAQHTPETPDPEERADGLGPLWVFSIASLAVVGVVVVAGAVNSWWILVPGMCVYFAAAVAALASIMRLLDDDGSTL
jgi:fatty acid desaturase